MTVAIRGICPDVQVEKKTQRNFGSTGYFELFVLIRENYDPFAANHFRSHCVLKIQTVFHIDIFCVMALIPC